MDYLLTLAVLLCIYLILVSSFNLLVGSAGLFSFSHAAFYALGAYVAGVISTKLHLPWFVGVVAAPIIGALAGVVLSGVSLRLRDEYLMVATLGFHLLIVEVLLNAQSVTGGAMGLVGIAAPALFETRLSSPGAYLLAVVPLTVTALWVIWNLQRAAFGRALRALREDETAATTLGKPVTRLKISVFAAASGFAALAGALYAFFTRFLDPYAFSFDIDIALFAMVLVGGLGSFWGGLLGGAVLLLVPEGLKLLDSAGTWYAPAVQMGYGLLILLFLFLRPNGFIPEVVSRERPRGGRTNAEQPTPADHAALQARPTSALAVVGLNKSFGGMQVVRDATFRTEPGAITALIGPNGAGKTTLFNLINGLLVCDTGEVRLGAMKVNGLPPYRIAQLGVTRSFQDLRIFGQMTALENVLVARQHLRTETIFGALMLPFFQEEERQAEARARTFLELVGLGARADIRASELSYGQQKLVALARALATEADIYLFDELAAGVAPAILERVIGALKDLRAAGKTVLLIEHNFQFVRELADHVVFLNQGSVEAEGSANDLAADANLTAIYFGGGAPEALQP